MNRLHLRNGTGQKKRPVFYPSHHENATRFFSSNNRGFYLLLVRRNVAHRFTQADKSSRMFSCQYYASAEQPHEGRHIDVSDWIIRQA